jgi:NAD(P)-dependent dehydrogenase (short-subunit alcohol dehydrogenase family)
MPLSVGFYKENHMFADKVAVITGAGSGIGRALAVELAQSGARLAISDVKEAGLAETAGLCEPGADVRTYRLDVSGREAVFEHADAVQRDFGAAHFLFNNAGATLVGTVAHTDIDEFEWLLGINLWGVIYATRAFLPKMLEQREGHIVNMSSIFGMVAYRAQGAYNVSKFGVRGLTECLWQELQGTGVRAVCVHPGGIRTNIERAARRCRAITDEDEGLSEKAERLLRTPPARVAGDILAGLKAGRRRIITGYGSTRLYWLSRLFPNHYGWFMDRFGY